MSDLRRFSTLFALLFVLAAAGCRDGDGGGGDGDPDGGGNQGGDTIYDVQDPESGMAIGTSVTLREVVVVAVDSFGSRTGGLYVAEPDGGAYSGVFVFLTGTEAADLAPGDLVDIEGGVKDEFGLEDTCDRDSDCTVTEIAAPQNGSISITKVGTGEVPDPEVLAPEDLAADDTEAEKWEGVLIQFEDSRVLRAPECVSDCSDETLKQMDVTGPFNVQSELAPLDDSIAEGDCYSSITGIGHYIFQYRLFPREAGDLAAASEDTCLPPEEGDALCGDGMDNDLNGFADCEDFGCLTAEQACPADPATVVQIQDPNSGDISEGDRVALTGVVVTAVDGDRFWVADNTTAAQYDGVFVFHNEALPGGFDVGTTLDLDGTVTEFDSQLTELTQPILDPQSIGTGGDPQPLTNVEPSTLAGESSGEPHEGVLVKIENVEVLTADPDSNFGQITVGAQAMPLFLDDTIYDFNADFEFSSGDCIRSITGVMDWNPNDDHRTLLPRSMADFQTNGGVCN